MKFRKTRVSTALMAACAALAMLCSAQRSNATAYNYSGTVAVVSSQGSMVANGNTQNPNEIVVLPGPGVSFTIGQCATDFVLPLAVTDDLRGQQIFANAMAAHLAGSTVTVFYDDSVRTAAGVCIITALNIT